MNQIRVRKILAAWGAACIVLPGIVPAGFAYAATSSATVATGDAAASADVVNVVNTTITDSEGLISFLNLFEPYVGDIDLSNLQFTPEGCEGCVVRSLGASDSVTNANTSTIVNDVEVAAGTGGNDASSDAGSSTIVTGNAVAAANVVNIANTNIVDSNYLLLVLNDFTLLAGDVIFPGKAFFSQFLNGVGSGGATGAADISNSNSSVVSNDVGAFALSGGNTASAESGGSATVTAGSTNAVANVMNMNNMNITANDHVVILVHVLGTWNGQVFSAPPGLSWQETPDGLMLYGSGAQDIFGDRGTVVDGNSANVMNKVSAYALTGDNVASSSDGDATVVTGDAAAAANVVNIVNTNVVGHNVLFGLVNIMGDWNGNLAFGRPDLWVGAQGTVTDNPLGPGSGISYTVTVINRGNADATDVVLTAEDGDAFAAIVDDPGSGTMAGDADSGLLEWDIPVIAAGETMQFTYHESLRTQLPFVGKRNFAEIFTATEHETDADPADNSEEISFPADGPATYTHISHLFVDETNSATSSGIAPGGDVTYRFLVRNSSLAGPADNVRLHETLYDPYGNVVSTSSWRIGNINTDEKYLVSYDALFPTSTPQGWYISASSLSGSDSGGNIWRTADVVSSSSVYVYAEGEATGTILSSPAPPPVIYVPAHAPMPPAPPPAKKNPRLQKITPTSTQELPPPEAKAPPSPSSSPSSTGIFMASAAGIFVDYAKLFKTIFGGFFRW